MAPNSSTSDPIRDAVAGARATFESERTRPLAWRKAQLRGIRALMKEKEGALVEALQSDMRKPRVEAWWAEIKYVLDEVGHALAHLDEWASDESVPTNLVNLPATSRIVREPLGVVLIIGPWNYPIQLVLSPLVGALAAGNTAIIKPSEVAPHASKALAEWLPKYVDASAVRVVEGGVAETTTLLEERFDHIFYTGNGRIARVVMAAAAKHLTPVTLELGGKSPTVVDEHVDLPVAVKRILWGKFFNAGQTCLAPDYVLVHERIETEFLATCQATLTSFFGPDPKASTSYGRIVNERHWRRIMDMLAEKKGEIVAGGDGDEGSRYIAPTILRNVPPDARVMQDEIFGPVLPTLPVKSIDEAIGFINARAKPLGLYVFTKNRRHADQIVRRTSAGGMCVNEVVGHFAVPDLPFGGVGASGMGAYHGRASFETFSHRKAVLSKATFGDLPVRYAPYTQTKEKWLRRIV